MPAPARSKNESCRRETGAHHEHAVAIIPIESSITTSASLRLENNDDNSSHGDVVANAKIDDADNGVVIDPVRKHSQSRKETTESNSTKRQGEDKTGDHTLGQDSGNHNAEGEGSDEDDGNGTESDEDREESDDDNNFTRPIPDGNNVTPIPGAIHSMHHEYPPSHGMMMYPSFPLPYSYYYHLPPPPPHHGYPQPFQPPPTYYQGTDSIYNTSMADPISDTRRNRGGVTEPFPEKLHRMLQACEKDGKTDVASFFSHGRAFAIHKPRRFVNEIMPKFFKQSKLTSFQRQLNLYGFQRISTGADNGGYWHPLFVKSRPSLCVDMKRIKIKGRHKDGRGAEKDSNFDHRFQSEKELSYSSPKPLSPNHPQHVPSTGFLPAVPMAPGYGYAGNPWSSPYGYPPSAPCTVGTPPRVAIPNYSPYGYVPQINYTHPMTPYGYRPSTFMPLASPIQPVKCDDDSLKRCDDDKDLECV